MQRPKGQGWAAFDRKQKEKQVTGAQSEDDVFPSISKLASSSSETRLIKNNSAPIRPYSSVLHPPFRLQPIACNHETQIKNNNFRVNDNINHQCIRKSDVTPVNMLKDIHIWADQNVIEDVLAAVDNDLDQASVLLKAMALSDSKPENPSLSQPSSSSQSCHSGPSTSTMSCPSVETIKSVSEIIMVENNFSDVDHEVLRGKRLLYAPVEPEWEEDDVYLSHRKDAVRMMRMASQHSHAANNAFSRGDHISAQQYSLRARDEWMVAEKLNAEAAKKILGIRNSNNDIWKLDLHGLHASEAVSVLKEHLQKIESEKVMSRSTSSDTLSKLEGGISRSASYESISGINSETKKKEPHQQRKMILHVITGIGNHSRGQAALPIAVKSFLIENGYRFDDARPGVFAVRLKFRHK